MHAMYAYQAIDHSFFTHIYIHTLTHAYMYTLTYTHSNSHDYNVLYTYYRQLETRGSAFTVVCMVS